MSRTRETCGPDDLKRAQSIRLSAFTSAPTTLNQATKQALPAFPVPFRHFRSISRDKLFMVDSSFQFASNYFIIISDSLHRYDSAVSDDCCFTNHHSVSIPDDDLPTLSCRISAKFHPPSLYTDLFGALPDRIKPIVLKVLAS